MEYKYQKFEIINHFTSKFPNCRYLEIGSFKRETFDLVNASLKQDIEPNPQGFMPSFWMTSDMFFENEQYSIEIQATSIIKKQRQYDVIFIDGLHLCDQVIRDVSNASEMLNPKGYIVLHDCLPEKEEDQERQHTGIAWMGDVWKAQRWLVDKFKDRIVTIEDANCGCGIINDPISFEIPHISTLLKYNWKDFDKNLLNSITWEKFLERSSNTNL